MSTITVRLNSEEKKLYTEYAKFKNIPLSTLLKKAIEEKIENELDLESISAYEERKARNEIELLSLGEIKKRLES
ncbi:MAG: toxin-antitoxin system protein [Clostridiales bacterium]|jgi:hypothetical protein|nr:toxin-antitoxin system protein [Clostridiales bacterium]